MNERDFGAKVAGLLHSGARNVAPATAAKLRSARLEALRHFQEQREPAWRPAVAGGPSDAGGPGFPKRFSPTHMLWAPLVAALLALAISAFWQDHRPDSDDLDVHLLAGDLPFEAFIDEDFREWLKGYSQTR